MTLYVIRLLDVDDYGVMALGMAFVAIVTPLSELGLGAAIVQRETVDHALLGRAHGFVLALAVAATAILIGCAPVISLAFDEPRLTSVLAALSMTIPIIAFSVVPRAALYRELRYKEQSITDMASTISAGCVTLALAFKGFGVWSLVTGHVLQMSLQTAGIVLVARVSVVPCFDWRGVRDALSFGMWVTLEKLVWVLGAQADLLVVGKLLGAQLLGFYSVGMDIAKLPQNKMQGMLNTIAFPAYSRVRGRGGDPSRYLLTYIRIVGLVSVPMFLGISCVAPEFVIVVLGAKWEPSTFPIQVVSLVIPLRIVGASFPPYLQACGHAKDSFTNGVITLVLVVSGVGIGVSGGLDGVALGWTLGYLAAFSILVCRVVRSTTIDLRELAAAVAKSSFPGLVMFGIVHGVRGLFPASVAPGLLLVVSVAVGMVSYVPVAYLLCRKELRELGSLARGLVGG